MSLSAILLIDYECFPSCFISGILLSLSWKTKEEAPGVCFLMARAATRAFSLFGVGGSVGVLGDQRQDILLSVPAKACNPHRAQDFADAPAPERTLRHMCHLYDLLGRQEDLLVFRFFGIGFLLLGDEAPTERQQVARLNGKRHIRMILDKIIHTTAHITLILLCLIANLPRCKSSDIISSYSPVFSPINGLVFSPVFDPLSYLFNSLTTTYKKGPR